MKTRLGPMARISRPSSACPARKSLAVPSAPTIAAKDHSCRVGCTTAATKRMLPSQSGGGAFGSISITSSSSTSLVATTGSPSSGPVSESKMLRRRICVSSFISRVAVTGPVRGGATATARSISRSDAPRRPVVPCARNNAHAANVLSTMAMTTRFCRTVLRGSS